MLNDDDLTRTEHTASCARSDVVTTGSRQLSHVKILGYTKVCVCAIVIEREAAGIAAARKMTAMTNKQEYY